jgi:hypothetical protein
VEKEILQTFKSPYPGVANLIEHAGSYQEWQSHGKSLDLGCSLYHIVSLVELHLTPKHNLCSTAVIVVDRQSITGRREIPRQPAALLRSATPVPA